MPKGQAVVVVESPAKAKTIAGLLGSGYQVLASLGHVRDLPRSKLGVDIEGGFQPRYLQVRKRSDAIKRLRKAGQEATAVYLATDPDREGEAIAWHVLEVMHLPKDVPVHRVTFHQLTSNAVREAFAHTGVLNEALIEAQQARRILDRLVGYLISPLLWKRVKGVSWRNLSAGRVQTAALRLVVDREREIEAFVPEEYWTLDARLAQQIPEPVPFLARLYRIGDAEADLRSGDEVQAVVDGLEGAHYWVESAETKPRRRLPSAPFTTSTLQQTASSLLRLSPAQTMRLAQQLYEGVDIGEEGTVGLITYMRTDSTHVAPEAQAAAREVIQQVWGEKYLPSKPPVYRTRSKSAQEAHEAIRPTDVRRSPKAMRSFLNRQQAALYELIWRRFVASQMVPAVYDVTTALIPTARPGREGSHERGERLPYLFRATGRVLRFEGFLAVYPGPLGKGEDTADGEPDEADGALPPLTPGEALDLLELIPQQHWTKPPPRYTEASLVKELERRGIGRPSTFAGMVRLIQDRGYVNRDGRALGPTPIGLAVCDLLVNAFSDLFDYEFTARMEDSLDAIANGEAGRLPTLESFWANFDPVLQAAKDQMPTLTIHKPEPVPTGEDCPECGGALVRRHGRYGFFVGCSNFPTCRYTKPEEPKPTGATCPECGHPLVEKRGRRGPFVGCSNYPQCRYIDRGASKALKESEANAEAQPIEITVSEG
jgi:DNA topoisomerase-1